MDIIHTKISLESLREMGDSPAARMLIAYVTGYGVVSRPCKVVFTDNQHGDSVLVLRRDGALWETCSGHMLCVSNKGVAIPYSCGVHSCIGFEMSIGTCPKPPEARSGSEAGQCFFREYIMVLTKEKNCPNENCISKG